MRKENKNQIPHEGACCDTAKEQKESKLSLLAHGIINLTIHIPCLLFTSFWGIMIIAVFDVAEADMWIWPYVTDWPLLIPLISCIVGIVRGVRYLKRDTHARSCLIFSVIGIFLYAGMMLLVLWAGSTF